MSSTPFAIPVEDLIHGNAYRLRSRNLMVGVWNDNRGGFVGIREKMGSTFLFTEYHYDLDDNFGTAHALRNLGPCPVQDLSEYIGHICWRCRRPSIRVEREEFRRPDPTNPSGEVLWGDVHLDDDTPTCGDEPWGAYMQSNDELFMWLSVVESWVNAEALVHDHGGPDPHLVDLDGVAIHVPMPRLLSSDELEQVAVRLHGQFCVHQDGDSFHQWGESYDPDGPDDLVHLSFYGRLTDDGDELGRLVRRAAHRISWALLVVEDIEPEFFDVNRYVATEAGRWHIEVEMASSI